MRGIATPILRIASEGWVFLLLLLAAALAAFLAGHWLLFAVCIVGTLLAATFFREVPRVVRAKPSGILAPVDGVVTFRRECHDPYLGREAIRIGITVTFMANYLLRAPIEGEVVAIEGASKQVSCIRSDEGESVLLAVTRGSLFGAAPVWQDIGDRLGQGRHCGARRLARVIDIYLPAECRVEVQLGQPVTCGSTVLATLLRRSA